MANLGLILKMRFLFFFLLGHSQVCSSYITHENDVKAHQLFGIKSKERVIWSPLMRSFTLKHGVFNSQNLKEKKSPRISLFFFISSVSFSAFHSFDFVTRYANPTRPIYLRNCVLQLVLKFLNNYKNMLY